LIPFLRGESNNQTRYLMELEEQQVEYAIPSLCGQELLQGSRTKQDWNLLETYLKTQILIHPADSQTTYFEAAKIYYDLRRRGVTVRSFIDCLIAQLCLELNLVLLHQDNDFKKIAAIRSLKFVKAGR